MFSQKILWLVFLFCSTSSYALEDTKFSTALVNKSKTNQQAMNDLGDVYWFGNATTINKKKAIDLYEKASSKGNISSSIKLYQLNRINMIQNADMITAKDYLDKAHADNLKDMASNSEISILRHVAFSDLPFHTYTNINENIKHLESIKNKQSAYRSEILFSLGKQYLQLPKYNFQAQDAKAISYIYEAVKLNHYKAMLFLADAYEQGNYGLLTNSVKANALREASKKAKKNEFNFIYDGFQDFPNKTQK